MAKVLNEICKWANNLPYWEQAALAKIIAGAEFNNPVYEELLQYLLEDNKLSESESPRPTLNFSQESVLSSTTTQSLHLRKIYNLQNVNALVPNQELTFGSALTLVFGANGSGKSGYARVIGNAAFTRGDREVLMDVTQPYSDANRQTAHIEFFDGENVYEIHHEIGQPCQGMNGFYVFDSTSSRVHLTKSNTISFTPAGLAYLTKLADVTDQVRNRLEKKIEQRVQKNTFVDLFPGNTEVTDLIAQLGPNTDIGVLRKLGTLTQKEKEQIETLDQQIAKIKSEKTEEKIAKIDQIISDLEKLITKLQNIEQRFSRENLLEINAQISEWQTRNSIAQNLGTERFKTEFFSQPGSEEWYDFVEAAHRLAKVESKPDTTYPQPGDHCLLCHQPLSNQARDLLNHLWDFLESDAQTKLTETENALNTHHTSLNNLDLEFLDDQAVSYRHLQSQDNQTLINTKAFLKTCQEYRDNILGAIQYHKEYSFQSLPQNTTKNINQIIDNLKIQKKNLEAADPKVKIAELENQKRALEHRQKLRQYLPKIEQFVNDCIWVKKARSPKVQRSTSHISRMFNKLFNDLVTQRYIELFENNLRRLGCPRSIRVKTKGRKGETIKQILIETDETLPSYQTAVEKVLSEGEQRAVALADFLTEVTLDENCKGIVLDDPVTSLDFEWKAAITPILIEEANQRQVIILTHDLHFLYCIKEQAAKKGVELEAHWIEKREGKPGWVSLNNSPLSERDYKSPKKAEEMLNKAKDPTISAECRQYFLEQGFSALRTSYEALVILELFADVVTRFGERLRIDCLDKVLIDPHIRDTIKEKVGLISRYIEGHLHSDQFLAQKPTPEILAKEIQEFKELRKKHRGFKKSMGIR